jgi:hypothetical protein
MSGSYLLDFFLISLQVCIDSGGVFDLGERKRRPSSIICVDV